MRRILAPLIAAALATTSIAGTALAAPAQHLSDTQSVVFCEDLTNDAGSVFAFAVESEQFGTFADLGFWASPSDPATADPTWIAGSSVVTFDELTVTVVYELFAYEPGPTPEDPPFGDPVGEATLEANLTPVGDPQPYAFRDRNGNHQFRQSGTIQEYSVSGTLALPDDITFDLAGCEAIRDETTLFANAPASSVSSYSELQLNCTWETGDGFVFLFASAGDFGTFADIFITSPDGEASGFTDSATLTTSGFESSWDLFELGEEGETGDLVGTADASAVLTQTNDRVNDRSTFGSSKVHITGPIYAVDGTLHLDTAAGIADLPMDAASCFAADLRATQHDSARRGPHGKPLANDTPDAAEPLAIGDSVTVDTSGTALEPEAACVGELEGDAVEFPIAHTAWWTFEGTGDPVTVDTTGSDFDTIVGVYIEEAGELVPIGCVDDTEFGLEAAITVDTAADVTYFVQAGGFGDQSGTLVLSIL